MKYLKKWSLADAFDLAKALNNQNVLKNLRDGLPFPYTTADAEYYIGQCLATPSGSQYTWAIDIDGKVIGSVGISRKENIHFRTAELGYYLAEEYWGRGITALAVKEACGYIFENTDILRIFAEPFAYNAASCRVLEKAGFEFEGVLKCNAVKNDTVLDMRMYSLIK